jgi:hypothetical protein
MEVRGVEVQIRGDKSVLCCLEGSVSAHQDSMSRATISFISTFLMLEHSICYCHGLESYSFFFGAYTGNLDSFPILRSALGDDPDLVPPFLFKRQVQTSKVLGRIIYSLLSRIQENLATFAQIN